MRSDINCYINLELLSLKRVEELELLELCSNVRLEEYIFVYIYLIRLILKKVKKEKRNRLFKLIY